MKLLFYKDDFFEIEDRVQSYTITDEICAGKRIDGTDFKRDLGKVDSIVRVVYKRIYTNSKPTDLKEVANDQP